MNDLGFFSSLGVWNWLILGVLLMAVELIAPGMFFLWFGLAAFATGALAFALPMSWQTQLMIFGLFAFIALFLWRRLQKSATPQTKEPALHQRGESLIGRQFRLEEPIINGQGAVRVDDTRWRITGPDLPSGTMIRVIKAEGAVLIIEQI